MLIGESLGPYRVLAKLGEGGMGEVYRARDTRLNRDVALKVLPDLFASDLDRLARFRREAQVLASLNHPNIAAIYGLEEADGVQALVLELVEGPTLADRISHGPTPVDEAIRIACEIADALEAAHEHGIIHRDLKPANVKVRPDGAIKVLDFGLAKVLADESAATDPSTSPTMTAMGSRAGVIIGTAAYMSPEQARGRAVDRRADIWAFGCLLFELLSGRRAFEGETISEVLAKVIEREPDWTLLPGSLPGWLVRLMRRCLEKDPKRRIRDMGDVRLELDDAQSVQSGQETTTHAHGAARRALFWSIPILVSLGIVATLVWQTRGPARTVPQPAHVQIGLPAGVHLAVDTDHPVLALSPDGTLLAFIGDENGTRRLYLRRLADRDARPVPGTEGAASPFFSPDGAWVAYYSGWGLAKVAVRGGVPLNVLITTPFSVGRGATWGANDRIVLAQSPNSGLAWTSLPGDHPQGLAATKPLTDPDLAHAWPSALPAGHRVLFTDMSGSGPRIALLDDRGVRPLNVGGTNPRFSLGGYILFARDGSLYSVPFDATGGAVRGGEHQLVEGLTTHRNGAAQFAVASNDVLAYVAGSAVDTRRELVWVDRQGNAEVLDDRREAYLWPRLSPDRDGRYLAVASFEGANLDVWTLDIARGAVTRVTTHEGEDLSPVWSPDGKSLAIASEVGGDAEGPALARIAIGASGHPQQLWRSPDPGDLEFPSSWSPDGKWILYMKRGGPGRSGASRDIMAFPADGAREPVAFLNGPADEYAATFSPDGKWVAFVSDESNRPEVYLAPFPGPGRRLPISTDGGTEPVWARNGEELFYRAGNRLMAVRFAGGRIESATAPRVLFEGRFEHTAMGAEVPNYDVSPDGRRFVMVRRKNLVMPRVIHIVLNWPEALGVHAEGAVR